MTASITEHMYGASIVIATGEDGENSEFNITETDSQEDRGQIDYELFHGHAVFNYSLLGDPDADNEEGSDVHDSAKEFA